VIYISAQVTILRKPEIVWKFLTDVERLPTWVEDLFEAEIVKGDDIGVGMRVDVARRVHGKRADATVEVSAWREPELIATETRLPGLLMLDRATLKEVAGGTELAVTSEIASDGVIATIFARPIGLFGSPDQAPPAQAIYERSIATFKKVVESSTLMPYR
jgi:uncharacterized protein YndB with AHSA1/START domain